MSVVAKKVFVEELSEKLSDLVTARALYQIADIVEDQLRQYEVEKQEDEADRKEFKDILEMFLDTKRVEGRSEKTLKRYKYIMNRYFEKDPTPIRDVRVQNLRQYLSSEKERGISDRTLQGYRDVFQSFFGWTFREGLIKANPCANLNPIKCKKEVKYPYSDVEIERLKEACETPRDRAMIAFLLSTGCRISEVCGLNRKDVDLRNLECTVLGKGNKERIVYLDSVCAMQLQNYFSSRKDSEEPLFVNRYNERFNPGGVRKCLHQLGDRAGVENAHPHRFRRTLATNLINHGMPIQEVAAILGHDKIDTTMTYVFIDKVNVKNSYRKYA